MCLAWDSVDGEVDERIGFGHYQSCGNKGSVGCCCCLPQPGLSTSQSRYLNVLIDLTGFRFRSPGDKSVRCALQANTCHVCTDVVWFRRTPYACSPAVDVSVLIVAVKKCVFFGSVLDPHPILWVGLLHHSVVV